MTKTQHALALSALATMGLLSMGFDYDPPGVMVSGSGTGRVDNTVYAPGMRFPILNGPAYANSQVYLPGGYLGPEGGQCDASNYDYPWQDNYCETRSWDMPLCPSGTGHQGQDIRGATCERGVNPTAATEDGEIVAITTYVVYLQADSGTLYRYMHMDHGNLQVSNGQRVTRGQVLGYIDNNMGDTPTTIHLHFDMEQNISGVGEVFAPTYMSLVRSYEELLGTPATPCAVVPPTGGVLDDSGSCFYLHGPSTTWRYVDTTGYDGDLHWTYGWDGGLSNWAHWEVNVEESGTYLVEAYVTEGYNETQSVRYEIDADGDPVDVVTSQAGATRWISLGEFDFVAGEAHTVAVGDDTGEASADQRHISADAIRLTPVGVEEDTGPVDTGTPDTGTPDTGTPDTGTPDTGTPDTGTPDTGTPDTGTPDTGTPDTGTPDTGTPDTGTPDTGTADTTPDVDYTTPDVDTNRPTPPDVTVDPGCACQSTSAPSPWWAPLALIGLVIRRRRSVR